MKVGSKTTNLMVMAYYNLKQEINMKVILKKESTTVMENMKLYPKVPIQVNLKMDYLMVKGYSDGKMITSIKEIIVKECEMG